MRNIIFLIAIIAGAITAVAAKKNVATDHATARKAQYIFYQASAQRQQGRYDSFFDLIEYAHRLDSTNTSIGFYYGVALMIMNDAGSASQQRALELMRRHVDAVPADYEEANYYYRACTQLDRWDEAKRIARRQTALFPERDDVLQRLAVCYAREQKFDSVLAIYNDLERRMGVNQSITAIKASTHEAMGDSLGALDEWRAFRSHAPLDAGANTWLASAFLDREMSDSAFYYARRAVELNPNDGFANFTLAGCYMSVGDTANYEKTIVRTLTECDVELEMKTQILRNYAMTRISQGDSTGVAIPVFRRIIDMHPSETDFRSLFLSYLMYLKRDGEALEQADLCLELEPDNTEMWKTAIAILYRNHDFDRLRDYFSRAIAANSNNDEMLEYVAGAQMSIKDYQASLATYDLLWNLASNDEQRSNIIGGKADVYLAMGDTIGAIKTYEQSLEVFPGNVGVMNNYAYCLANMGRNLDRALELIARAVTATPDNYNFLDTYAWVYYKRGDYTLALLYIEDAIKHVDDPNCEVIEHYGDILEANGRHADALVQWQRALDTFDEGIDRPEVAERLAVKLATTASPATPSSK